MLSISYKKSHQKVIRDWISQSEWVNPFAVTFNLKQFINIETDTGHSIVKINERFASQNLRHFLNKITKRYYGNSGVRFGKKMPVVPVLEGVGDHRLHYHLLIDLPINTKIEDVYPLFVLEWLNTQWGYGQVDIQHNPNDGWLNYITKLRSKTDVSESIDWMNFYHPGLITQ